MNGTTSTNGDNPEQALSHWMQQRLEAQNKAWQDWWDAVQAGVHATTQARDWSSVIEAQSQLLNAWWTQAAALQADGLQSWLALQSDMARATQQRMGLG